MVGWVTLVPRSATQHMDTAGVDVISGTPLTQLHVMDATLKVDTYKCHIRTFIHVCDVSCKYVCLYVSE